MVNLASSLIVAFVAVVVLNALMRWREVRQHGRRLIALRVRQRDATDPLLRQELQGQIEHEERLIEIIEKRSNNPLN